MKDACKLQCLSEYFFNAYMLGIHTTSNAPCLCQYSTYCLVNVLRIKYMFVSECNLINTDTHTLSGESPGRPHSPTMHGPIVQCLQPEEFHLQNATSSHDKLYNSQNIS